MAPKPYRVVGGNSPTKVIHLSPVPAAEPTAPTPEPEQAEVPVPVEEAPVEEAPAGDDADDASDEVKAGKSKKKAAAPADGD